MWKQVTLPSPQLLLVWVPAITGYRLVGPSPVQTRRSKTHLALGLCFTLCTKPIRQRGLNRVLDLERVYPAQPWRVPECHDSRTHARPTRDSSRVDILGNSIRKGLLSDIKSFGSYALR